MNIPEWMASIAGFDGSGPWLPIVCTGGRDRQGRQGHEEEWLGLTFKLADGLETRWAPRIDESGLLLIHITRLTEGHLDRARAGTTRDAQVYYGLGSIVTECPRGCEDRFSRERWGELITGVWSVGAPKVDVSLYR